VTTNAFDTPLYAGPPTEATLDQLTRDLTAFESFRAMLDAEGNYRPTIMMRDLRHVQLADAYDLAMIGRGDPRRAYRGSLDNRPLPITLTVTEGRQLMDFLGTKDDEIVDGGWEHVESVLGKVVAALQAAG